MPAFRFISLLLSITLLAGAHAGEADDIAGSLTRGQADEALQSADRALLKAPRDARLRLLRGNALAQLGRSNEAIQVFSSLTVDYPALPEPYNNLAAVYAQQGQLDRARTTLQMALQTNPAYATAHANLADVYAKLAAQSYEKALQRDVVERQNGQVSTPASPASSRLALVQDLVSRSAATASRPAETRPPVPPAIVTKPLPTPVVVAATKPAATPAVGVIVSRPEPKPEPKPEPRPEPKPLPKPEPKPATVAPVASPNAGKEAEAQILAAVNGWADAWSQRRVGGYLASYAKSFKPGGIGRSAWEQQRRERIEAAKRIEVKLANIRVKLEGDTATVRFVQRYKSDKLENSTTKTLVMEKNGSRWLIREERVG
ncbi:tetratricopeptide repeat protein [Chitinimonas arctica]|uniref:Tetratricopeptide repeat protein n=1 Tax=Chitinimonas arctica TaxID=2594795 RepID=A0A516SCI8_9NEIS|nr:nuclear transport factor 2 family protein [Chitinimonas arctica]QDQ25867.1 tetratricopeptide repeat protein [Chitinimonas arctica]